MWRIWDDQTRCLAQLASAELVCFVFEGGDVILGSAWSPYCLWIPCGANLASCQVSSIIGVYVENVDVLEVQPCDSKGGRAVFRVCSSQGPQCSAGRGGWRADGWALGCSSDGLAPLRARSLSSPLARLSILARLLRRHSVHRKEVQVWLGHHVLCCPMNPCVLTVLQSSYSSWFATDSTSLAFWPSAWKDTSMWVTCVSQQVWNRRRPPRLPSHSRIVGEVRAARCVRECWHCAT